MEFAAYAATNNPWLVARCAPNGSGCQLDHLELRAIQFQSLSPTKVLEKAVDMLRAGKIVVTALRDGARREMPAVDWRYWTISTSPVVETALVVWDVERREPIAGWTNFLISREHADRVRVALLGADAEKGKTREAEEETPEQKMTTWLTRLMKDQPGCPISKQNAHTLAAKDGLQRISDRAFDDRAWPYAVKASGVQKDKWSGRGRRSKAALIAARNRRT